MYRRPQEYLAGARADIVAFTQVLSVLGRQREWDPLIISVQILQSFGKQAGCALAIL